MINDYLSTIILLRRCPRTIFISMISICFNCFSNKRISIIFTFNIVQFIWTVVFSCVNISFLFLFFSFFSIIYINIITFVLFLLIHYIIIIDLINLIIIFMMSILFTLYLLV